MAELEELKKIKKVYGENFMKLCRSLFPTLLETEGRLFEILTSSFSDNSRTLYEDITSNELEEEFKSYIYSKIDVEDPKKKIIEKRTPYEILDEAGYELFECSSEKEIQSFKKYYAKGEELCTFNGGRLNRCVVFFAVKKDVEDIKREDFSSPKREDEYGTSVMGIQFNREGLCTVSIKNRYNHTVNNPDATYGNNLDNIAPGLTQSFAELLHERGLKLNNSNVEKFEIPGYVVASDGKYYKYNMEINGTYYCPGNVIIENGTAREIENNGKQMLIDYFILDTEKKTIEVCDENIVDSFIDGLQDIEKIEITKNKEKGNGIRTITIYQKEKENPVKIEISKDNEIIGYENENLTEVGDNFLKRNNILQELNLPQLTQVGDYFLHYNKSLQELNLPQLTQVGDYFLHYNKSLQELNLPQLKQVGSCFLSINKQALLKLDLPNLTQVGEGFLFHNKTLQELNLPNLEQVDIQFLYYNETLQELNLPNLKQVGNGFLTHNKTLQELNLPNLKQVGDGFLEHNKTLQKLSLPNLTQVGDYFLYHNETLQELSLPNLTRVGYNFLSKNKTIQFTPVGNQLLHSIKLSKKVKIIQNIIKNKVTPNDIANVDKQTALTTTEVTFAGRVIAKIREIGKKIFKGKDDSER